MEHIREQDLFVCRKCGECCHGRGGTVVSEADIYAISKYTGIPAERIRTEYCVPLGSKLMLGQKPDGYCIFYEGLCSIHPVKPSMCRKWPFIEAVLRSPQNWEIMASVCPGIVKEAPIKDVIQFIRMQVTTAKHTSMDAGDHGCHAANAFEHADGNDESSTRITASMAGTTQNREGTH